MIQVVAVLLAGAVPGLGPVVALVPLGTGLATPVQADPWIALSGEEIRDALTGRALSLADGTRQDFLADGRTLSGNQWGRWSVQDDRYCSVWPPSDRWSCYDLAQRGLDLRFRSEGGEASIGRYIDLN